MTSAATNKSKKKPNPHELLFSRPGYLVRRLHQLHVSMFFEMCGDLGITPVQFGILTILGEGEMFEQVVLGEELGVDRSTMSNVVARLESRNLIGREASRRDGRSKCVWITAKGRKCLEDAQAQVEKVQGELVSALPEGEREQFVRNLRRLVEAANGSGRTTLRLAKV